MRPVRKRKRRADPAKNARVLLIESDPAELDRLATVLRQASFRVVALSRADALVPLSRLFRPEVAVIGITGEELEVAKVGRRLDRRFKGAVPVVYVGPEDDANTREFCFEFGAGIDYLPRGASTQLLQRLRSLLRFKACINDVHRAEFEQRSPTLHDEVTGLYNRRFLLEMVAAEARRGERYGGGFSVVIAELDDFMSFRERYGDEVCDRLMVYGAVLLKQVLRDADVLARVGRYHFAMLLPSMTSEALPKLIDRLQKRFSLARFDLDGRPVRASLTLGHASFPDVVGPAQQIFAKAIQDLDRAREEKRMGPPPRAAV